MDIEVVCGDVFEVKSDLLLMKYADVGGGVHRKAAALLMERKLCTPADLCPAPGQAVFIDSPPGLGPAAMMFLGIGELFDFGYAEMKRFAERAIELLAARRPAVSHVTTTIHGVGYGLDAAEAVQNLVLGFTEGIRKHFFAPGVSLNRITIIDRDASRVRVMSTALAALALLHSKDMFAGRSTEPRTVYQFVEEDRTEAPPAPLEPADDDPPGSNVEHEDAAHPLTRHQKPCVEWQYE